MRYLLLILLFVSYFAANASNSNNIHRIKIDSENELFYNTNSFLQGDYQKLDSLLTLSKKIGYSDGITLCYINLNRYYLNFDLFDSAFIYADLCLQQINLVSNPRIASMVNETIGKMYLRLLDYPAAYNYLKLAEDGYSSENLEDDLYRTYNYLGILSGQLGKKQDAIGYFQKILERGKRTNDKRSMAKAYNNLALLSDTATRDDFDSIIGYYNNAVEINLENKSFAALSGNYSNIAYLYLNSDSLDKAISYLNQALHLTDSLHLTEGKAKAYLILGQCYLKQKDFKNANNALLNALELSEDSPKLVQTKKSTLEFLYKLHNSQGNLKLALEYYKQERTIADSLLKENSTNEIEKLEMKFRFEKKMQESQLKAKRKLVVSLVIIAITLLIIVILLQSYIIQKARVKKTMEEKISLESDLDIKKQELSNYALNMVHSNEKNLRLVKDLLEKKHLFKKENHSIIDQLIRELKEDQFKDIWEEFEIRFSQTHGGFYKKLLEQFPDLTLTEKRMCAFLRLDMTTKEISATTGQSQRAIEMARARLRKKLGLTNNPISISQFLQELG